MKAWPFMFAASRTSDYQFVVLPEIFDPQSCGSLRDRLEMDEIDPARIRTASLSSPREQALSCVYRSGPIVVGDRVHVDSAGRKLLFASGLVVEDLPETLDEVARIIDANAQWFEKKLDAFLNSTEKWTPIVTKSVRLHIDRPVQIPGSVRLHASPVAILSLISVVLFVLCAGLYLKNRSLESQLIDSRPPAPKPAVDNDRKEGLDSAPSVTPRVPENDPEKKLTVQPTPTPSQPSSVPEAELDKKEPVIAQPVPTPGPLSSPVPEAVPEKKEPVIALPAAPALSLQPPVPKAGSKKKKSQAQTRGGTPPVTSENPLDVPKER